MSHDNTLAERLRDILADCVEGHSFVDAIALVDDLAVEAADALDAKDAEIARWKRMSVDNRNAFAAMRNDLNELFGDMPSEEASLRYGPEMFHDCAAIVAVARRAMEDKDAEIARLHEALERIDTIADDMGPMVRSRLKPCVDAALRK